MCESSKKCRHYVKWEPQAQLAEGKGHCHHWHERGLCHTVLHFPSFGAVIGIFICIQQEDVQALDSHRLELVEKLNQAPSGETKFAEL